ncbi:AbaSI family restriction endonuclease [Paenibacillus sp. FSL M7-1046]|uniref:AbaSI family restriction endonuclease n=1 Tax=Paenibacillus sp. FSL M7-1046 TaxID=2975315 RepID=UPI0030FC4443
MDKRDYLVKTLSRTKRKDYENYIINAIWHKLDNMELKPVSQQYVKRKDGGYALMDLYFSQLQVAIEVDESYHKNNQEADKLRMDDIIAAVNENENENTDFICLRIDASQPIEAINKRIIEVVSIIKNKASRIQLKWLTYEEELSQIKQQEYLSIYDNVSFKQITDIANNVFDKGYIGFQRSGFRVSDTLWVWCPKLSVIVDEDAKSAARGWLNFLSDDWTYIDESHENQTEDERMALIKDDFRLNKERAVFANYRDSLGIKRYRFAGIFKSSGLSPDNKNYIRYSRIDDKTKVFRAGGIT